MKVLEAPGVFMMPVYMEREGEVKVFFSYCSRHQVHDPNCEICQNGCWITYKKEELKYTEEKLI